jgi:excisionase family DNA binding protein
MQTNWREMANSETLPEPFVDAARAAEFLGIKPRRVLEMARAGELPAYPLGRGARRTWRFRLTEICATVAARR